MHERNYWCSRAQKLLLRMFVAVPFSFDGKIDKIKEIEHRFVPLACT